MNLFETMLPSVEMLKDIEEKTLCLDCVYVIDATADMKPYIDVIKEYACAFHQQMIKTAKERYNYLNVRVKAIWFRDFYYDGKYAYGESRFFE